MKTVLAILLTLAATMPGVVRLDFEKDPPDKAPSLLAFGATDGKPGGRWRVLSDGENRVLAQVESGGNARRSFTAVVDSASVKDVRVSVRIKSPLPEPTSGTTQPSSRPDSAEQGGGIVWRFRNQENYFAAHLDFRRKRINLYRFVDGNRIRFDGEDDLKLKPGRWYTLRVEHAGERIKVYLDDDMICDARDRHLDRAGKFGVWMQANATAYFDDLSGIELEPRSRERDRDRDRD